MPEAVPQQMKAAALQRFGGLEELELRTIPVPRCGEDDVLVRLEAAGVAVWDPLEREGAMAGLWDHAPRFPYVPGSDGAGVVAAVGENVERFKEGDRVYVTAFGNEKGGTYAEYVAVHQDYVAAIPAGVSVEQAATLASDGITALCGLEALDLKEGETLLIFGASGGVGHMALQLARQLGAKVCAIASREDGVQLVRQLGAEAVAEGHDDRAIDETCRAFAPEGFDAALALAGGERCQQALAHVRKGGRIAAPEGVEPPPVAPPGHTIRAFNGIPTVERFDRLNRLIESAPFHLEVDHLYPMDQVRAAHRAVLEHHIGKLALRIH